ncbi:hypothetical protein LTR12_005051 [Friedmanniomyces endolithicus]|nr:hypothetical protein LTR12_005051 [Friedmanniomyces endolithicus]
MLEDGERRSCLMYEMGAIRLPAGPRKQQTLGLGDRSVGFQILPHERPRPIPAILWIGCSDSRVPETTVLGLKPGDVFTHRNIANIVSPTDLSLLSVVEFSVAHLKVKHIVVCGHSKCGGVAGCLANGKLGGSLDIWLQPLRALREKHDRELKGMEVDGQKAFMSAANVRQGVEVMKRIPTVIDAMKERGLQVHGLVYDLASGELEDVDCDEKDDVAALREAAFERK